MEWKAVIGLQSHATFRSGLHMNFRSCRPVPPIPRGNPIPPPVSCILEMIYELVFLFLRVQVEHFYLITDLINHVGIY